MEKQLQTRICRENDKKALPHFKLYKSILFEVKYKDVPYQAKAMYTKLANKLSRGVKSEGKEQYYDVTGKPFVKYTIKELADEFNISESTAKRYKKSLVKCGLISTSKNGQQIYLNKPEITKDSLTYNNGKKLSYMHMPKFLETNDNYNKTSTLARLVYTVVKDRFTYTLSTVSTKKDSKYKDERGRVFCIFPNEELTNLFGVHKDQIKAAKDELMALGLLKQVRAGINKPYRLYLYTPLRHEQLTEEEVQEEIETKKYVLTPPEKSIGVHTYYNQEVKKEDAKRSNTGLNNTLYNNTSLNNTSTNDMYAMYKESETVQTEHDSEENKKNNKLRSFNFSPLLQKTLTSFTYKELETILGIIVKSKNEFNDYYHTSYSLESLDFELKEMIKRVKDKMRDENKGISKFRGYLKQSVLNEFKKYDISLYQSELELSGEKWMAISQEKLNNQYSNFGKQIDATEEELDALGVG
ncbi:replication initiator protein A [Staphylococcus xylosus]|uniref:replication initiator protein A n=1 Tax=Staphylococcus xylosus TaxID=1288 RepID=UPI00368EF832